MREEARHSPPARGDTRPSRLHGASSSAPAAARGPPAVRRSRLPTRSRERPRDPRRLRRRARHRQRPTAARAAVAPILEADGPQCVEPRVGRRTKALAHERRRRGGERRRSTRRQHGPERRATCASSRRRPRRRSSRRRSAAARRGRPAPLRGARGAGEHSLARSSSGPCVGRPLVASWARVRCRGSGVVRSSSWDTRPPPVGVTVRRRSASAAAQPQRRWRGERDPRRQCGGGAEGADRALGSISARRVFSGGESREASSPARCPARRQLRGCRLRLFDASTRRVRTRHDAASRSPKAAPRRPARRSARAATAARR